MNNNLKEAKALILSIPGGKSFKEEETGRTKALRNSKEASVVGVE